jgi:hypothetical protein
MATKRPSSPLPSNSSTRRPAKGQRRTDPLAQLHAYRRRIAAQFNYDSARIIEYVTSGPLPPGTSLIYVDAAPPPHS